LRNEIDIIKGSMDKDLEDKIDTKMKKMESCIGKLEKEVEEDRSNNAQ